MDCDALAARDVADDLFTVQWIAATRAHYHQIVNAANDDRVVAHADQTLHGPDAATQPRLFLLIELLKLLGTKVFGNYVTRHEFAVADCGQQIVDAPVSVVASNTLHLTIAI